MNTDVRSYPLRQVDVVLVDNPAESVLVAPGHDASHLLNPTARAIWELCDGQTDPQEMVGAICQVFSVAPDVAQADVSRALQELTAAGLVTWSTTADSATR